MDHDALIPLWYFPCLQLLYLHLRMHTNTEQTALNKHTAQTQYLLATRDVQVQAFRCVYPHAYTFIHGIMAFNMYMLVC